jgi:hypothetical protein
MTPAFLTIRNAVPALTATGAVEPAVGSLATVAFLVFCIELISDFFSIVTVVLLECFEIALWTDLP